MEKSFDFGKLLQNNEKKHKSKPMQFVSVAGGVKKRLETDIKKRKKLRLFVFDKIRNIPSAESPTPIKEVQSRVEHRRMQLEKWKEEKEKKKKEAMLQKKKPFIAGVPHNALKFVPPPQPAKAMPSTSGRVTRSQSSRNTNNMSKQNLPKEIKQSKNDPHSFAPKNAKFNPILKDIIKPTLETKAAKVENKNKTEVLIKEKSKVKANSKKGPVKQYERNLRSRPDRTNNSRSKVNDVSPQKYSSASLSSVNSGAKSPDLKTPRKSIGKSKLVTPKNPVPKSESSSEEKLRSPKSIELSMTPQQIAEEAKRISPCVTLSRGKDNARKEMKKKMEEGLLGDDVCEMDSVEHFRRQMDSEIKRMTEMCDTWEKISDQIQLPDAVQEAILSAIGQARLLMSQKLQQFASLLLRCQCPEPGQALVTPGDLHGFWDMVFMQVENVDIRFKKLEEMRAREWAEEKPVEVKKKPVAKPAVFKSKPAATSRLRDMIAAARKAKKEQSDQTPTEVEQQEKKDLNDQKGQKTFEAEQQEEKDLSDQKHQKTFEAGFFCIQSPVKSPRPVTPLLKPSLLKAVLSSEAKKAAASKSAASYAMLRASLIGKNVENEVFNDPTPLTPINLTATPSRSILKSNKKSSKKSIKVVLFNESDQDIQETIKDIQKFENEENEDHNVDSGLSSMDTEEKENKSRRKSKLTRQEAFEGSPIMTRSRRKSIQVANEEDTRNRNKLQEVNVDVQTPRKSRKSIQL